MGFIWYGTITLRLNFSKEEGAKLFTLILMF